MMWTVKGTPPRTLLLVALILFGHSSLFAQAQSSPEPAGPAPAAKSGFSSSSADFTNYARKLRETSIKDMAPTAVVPTQAKSTSSGRHPWRTGIVTTVFWVGHASDAKSVNTSSAWDPDWEKSYGGFDNPSPEQRREFVPREFEPKLNPFYVALPYNDVAGRATKPEARVIIPWFQREFMEEGKSVCHNRWVAIRNATGKMCYAQWSDCGPYRSDHWQYVFGNEKPKPNANGGAGLNVSPAVRDFLELESTDVTDWRFAEFSEVPKGPWARYGRNNPFVQLPAVAP